MKTTTNAKLTNASALGMVLAMAEVQANTELVAKLETMKAQFEKKANRSTDGVKKLTPTQIENQELAQVLKSMLTQEPQAQAELQKSIGVETSQKMTAIVKILGDEVVKTKVKGKTMVALAEQE